MNRREFVGAALVGAGSFALPSRAIEQSRPVLMGLTDEEMAAMIGRFPQGPNSSIDSYDKQITVDERGWLVGRRRARRKLIRSSWRIEGSTIHVQTWIPAPAFKLYPMKAVDVRSLEVIQLNISETHEDFHEYRRIESNGQFGWFSLYPLCVT